MDVLGPEHEIKQNLQVKPRNFISKSANITPIEVNKTFTRMENTINGEDSLLTLIDLHTRRKNVKENSENSLKLHTTNVKGEEVAESVTEVKIDSTPKQCENEENSRESRWKKKETEDQWENIQEMVESDFLTSPADIYLNRRVELEDAVISKETKECFAQLCDEYHDVFSKNNQDIGKTTLTLILPTKIFNFSSCHQTAQKCHFIPLSIPCQQSQNCSQPFPAVQPAKCIKSDV